jgi:WD40 repeat protein
VKLWDVKSGKTTATLTGHTGSVNTLAFSPDGQRLASGSADKTVRLWDPKSGETTVTPMGHDDEVRSVAFGPHDNTLASASNRGVKLWSIFTGVNTATLNERAVEVGSRVALTLDGKTFAAVHYDETIGLWDVATRMSTATVKWDHPSFILALSPDGKTLATSGVGGAVLVLDVATGKVIRTLVCDGTELAVMSLVFRPDGHALAAGYTDGTINLWGIATRRKTEALTIFDLVQRPPGPMEWPKIASLTGRGHDGPVWSLTFSPDGDTLASGGADRTIKLWDVKTGNRGGGPAEKAKPATNTDFQF